MPQKTDSQPARAANTAGRPARDPEIHAMGMCVRVLEPLDEDARERVLRHLADRFRVDLECS